MLPFSRSIHTRGFLYRTRPWTRQGAALQAACTILSGYGGRHWNLVQTGENVWRALCWGRGDSSFSGAESRIKLSKADEVLSHAAHYSYSPYAERPNGLRYEGRLLAAELILA